VELNCAGESDADAVNVQTKQNRKRLVFIPVHDEFSRMAIKSVGCWTRGL
jgi:hypothetical protein